MDKSYCVPRFFDPPIQQRVARSRTVRSAPIGNLRFCGNMLKQNEHVSHTLSVPSQTGEGGQSQNSKELKRYEPQKKKPRNAKGSGRQIRKDSSPKPETGRGASPNKTRSGRVTHNLWISNAWINMFRMQHEILIKKYSYWATF